MAKQFGQEHFTVSKIHIHNDYTVDVFKKQFYVSKTSGIEIIIDDGSMWEVITPDTDLSVSYENSEELFWATDEVKEICNEQFDEETVSEWNAMSDEEKQNQINRD
jgi:hypothetical protein